MFKNRLKTYLNSGPCSSFNCLGHFKNVYDDDDDVVAGAKTGRVLYAGGSHSPGKPGKLLEFYVRSGIFGMIS